ncbi:hypothetical protein GCM10023093_11060 [Nemorincola caseinilytica]|uniref:DinB-like domain-containing protein n=1 Tax=Nemorincola caseinilytica TaxID=2054315 RepID=A0ABP8N8K6_9BACT
MENLQQKANFLRSGYTAMLQQLDENAGRKWGKMNVRQMIEHMSDYIRIASGRTYMDVITPAEHLPRMQAFLESEKPFRENTPNSLMADEPPALRHTSKQAAIAELQEEVDHFFKAYESEPGRAVNNPFFGVLNYDQQVQLLYKHSTHHLRQFGVDMQ